MRSILTTLLSLLIIQSGFRGKNFVFGALNQTCMTIMCSCCVNKHCGPGLYFPNECRSGCIDGHRAARCYEMCTYDCKSCMESIHICDKCFDGFYVGPHKDCTLKCPATCKTCSSNVQCDTCKEGFFDKEGSSTCDYYSCPTNCECNETNCVACKNGFYDIDNSCNKTCPLNCVACSSVEHCNKCRNGFYNGIGPNGDISPRLNDCTFKCRDTCVSCNSYDNCLKCADGKYGLQCQANCSVGCKDNICLKETGICNCTSNFYGEKCSNCLTGKHGNMCDQFCPRNCKNNICHKLSGNCTEGCNTVNMFGEKCDQCFLGRYGIHCENICSENCKNRKCDKDNGKCSEGCESNFVGTNCTECINDRYGDNCQDVCPGTCADQRCTKQFGHCYQCIGNFDGSKCDTCKPGFHGSNCDKNCSLNCLNNSCDKELGRCENGCKINYSGDKCCAYNSNCEYCSSNTECKQCKSGYFHQLCTKRCPGNCKGACEFLTGACQDCKINYFGPMCNLSCSENCNVLESNVRRCAFLDGTCENGCKASFFGLTCNKACSSFCIDNVCTQETGVCIKGCIGSQDDPACPPSLEKAVDNSTVAVIAVLATLLAVACVVIGFLMWKKIVQKIRSADRHPTESLAQVHFENLSVEEQNTRSGGQTAVSDEENITYEVLDKTEASEHAYDLPKRKTPQRTNTAGNKEYENI